MKIPSSVKTIYMCPQNDLFCLKVKKYKLPENTSNFHQLLVFDDSVEVHSDRCILSLHKPYINMFYKGISALFAGTGLDFIDDYLKYPVMSNNLNNLKKHPNIKKIYKAPDNKIGLVYVSIDSLGGLLFTYNRAYWLRVLKDKIQLVGRKKEDSIKSIWSCTGEY